jgi:AraC family ethanolamine operon transcriptional activator
MASHMRAEFDDADQFAQQVRLWGWQGRISQIGRGDFRVSLRMTSDDRGRVLRTLHGVANLRDVNTPIGSRTFGMVIPDGSSNAWCGRSFDRAILQLMPRRDYVGSNGAGHLGYQMVFPDSVVEETLVSMERPELLDGGAFRIELDPVAAERIASWIESNWLDTNPDGTRTAADQTLAMLLSAFTEEPKHSREMPVRRQRAVARAREFMEANIAEELTLADICRAAGASRRTLTSGFQEQIGVSPMRYLKLIRLNRVHETLLRQLPGSTTIADVANAAGFWHMGQLARDYRQLFGELPGETRARL